MLKAFVSLLCAVLFVCAVNAQSLISPSPEGSSSVPAATQAAPAAAPAPAHPVNFFVYERARLDAWQWFAAPPEKSTYRYLQSLLRLGLQQQTNHWDWELELAQPAVFDVPSDSISPVSAQGQ